MKRISALSYSLEPTAFVGDSVSVTGELNAPDVDDPIVGATVVITVNGTPYNAVTNGTGHYTTSFTPATSGTYTVTAAYAGNSEFLSSSASGYSCTVSKKYTYVSASATSVNVGSNSIISGHLDDTTVDVPITGATISISVDDVVVGTATTNGSGDYSYSYTTPPAGTHQVVVSYAGNDMYRSTSSNTSFTVTPTGVIDPGMSVDDTKGEITYGEDMPLVAEFSYSDVTGTVNFLVTDTSSNEWRVNNVPVTDGSASSSLSGLPVGYYSITVTYSGDAKYMSVTESGVNGVEVIPASP